MELYAGTQEGQHSMAVLMTTGRYTLDHVAMGGWMTTLLLDVTSRHLGTATGTTPVLAGTSLAGNLEFAPTVEE
jgi:hypothetical protein